MVNTNGIDNSINTITLLCLRYKICILIMVTIEVIFTFPVSTLFSILVFSMFSISRVFKSVLLHLVKYFDTFNYFWLLFHLYIDNAILYFIYL